MTTPRLIIALILAVATFILMTIVIESTAPYSYHEINLGERLLPPSPKHILGTDSLGRDLFVRLLHGFRLSLAAALLSIALSALLGISAGISSALYRSLQLVIDAIFNFFYIVPSIFIAAVMAFVIGFGLHIVVIAIALRLFPTFYRITRTISLSILAQPYIESAKAMGASTLHILTHYIAREALHTIAILSIYSFPEALAIEITLSFIGLGIQPPTPSIGSIMAEGVRYIAVAPHIIITPAIATFITILIADMISESIERYRREQLLLI